MLIINKMHFFDYKYVRQKLITNNVHQMDFLSKIRSFFVDLFASKSKKRPNEKNEINRNVENGNAQQINVIKFKVKSISVKQK